MNLGYTTQTKDIMSEEMKKEIKFNDNGLLNNIRKKAINAQEEKDANPEKDYQAFIDVVKAIGPLENKDKIRVLKSALVFYDR